MNVRIFLFQLTVIHVEYILLASCGRIWTLYTTSHSWNNTYAICRRHGQEMVRLKTDIQHRMFKLFMRTWEANEDLMSDIWVGLYDLEPGNGGDFMYTWTDGTALGTFLVWARNEPNGKGTENCVRYTRSQNYRTFMCDNLYATVCETETECWFTEEKESVVFGLEEHSETKHDVETCKRTCLEMHSESQLCIAVEYDGSACRTYTGSYVYTAISTPGLQMNPQSTVYLKRCYEGKLGDASQSSQRRPETTVSSTLYFDDTTTLSDGTGNTVFGGSTRSLGGTTSDGLATSTSSDALSTSSDGLSTSSDGLSTSSDGLATLSDGLSTSSDGLATSSIGLATSSDGLAPLSDRLSTSSDGMVTPTELITSSEGIAVIFSGLMTKSDGTAPSGGMMTSDGETRLPDATGTDIFILSSMTDSALSATGGATSVLTLIHPSDSTSTPGACSDATKSPKCACFLFSARSSDEMSQLIKKLILEKNSLSSTRRKKTSAEDARPSAQNIGKMGIVFTVLPFVGMILMDCMRLLTFLQRRKRVFP